MGMLVALLTAGSGCATVLHGTTQRLTVTSNPPGATAVVLPQNVTLTTPSAITLERKKVYTVVFEAPGYERTTVYVNRQMSDAANGNALVGGLVGLETDFQNGAAFVLTPDPVHAEMTPVHENAAQAAGALTTTKSVSR